MNENNVLQIFARYIEKFEWLNNDEHEEYYKWPIAEKFHDEMDRALSAPDSDFAARLLEVKKLSSNLIDSYTQPFYGLTEIAKKDQKTVREMFLSLYEDDRDDIGKKQKKVSDFLIKSHELREKYFQNSYLYKNDMHSVTGYLFLYDPDHNYFFKATNAQKFADCIGFYEDWGVGDAIKLDVYYNMCDQLVDRIKNNKELMATDASRFEPVWRKDNEKFYKDPEKHVLAFDLIYCCSAYDLFDGITFSRPNTGERRLLREKEEKAAILAENLDKAKNDLKKLNEAMDYLNSVFIKGASIHHRKYGKGTVKESYGDRVIVDFLEAGEKQLGIAVPAANKIIESDYIGYKDRIEEYADILKRGKTAVESAVEQAERDFAPYAEYNVKD